MTTLFTYARDAETDTPLFGVVSSDEGAEYVFPEGETPWWPSLEDRLPFITVEGEERPTDAQSWLNLATSHLGPSIEVDPAYDDAESDNEARKIVTRYLRDSVDARIENIPATGNVNLIDVPAAYAQTAADYPGFGEGEDDDSVLENQDALDNLVQLALGPIDPDGPNGWILRAVDGAPAEGDENEYIHWSGTMTPVSDEPQEDQA